MVLTQNEDDDNFLSDESSFYGGDDLRSELEERVERFNPSQYWAFHHLQLSVMARCAIKEEDKMDISVTESREAFNIYEDYPSGRQLSETVETFMKRLPPLTTSIIEYGPWIYVANPYSPRNQVREDQATFVRKGRELLEEFTALKAGIEASMPGKAKTVIGRKLTPLRAQLSLSLIALARETNCTSGKWMLFPPPSLVNAHWSLIARATISGELGHAAKVATDDGTQNSSRLICVYTPDFSDKKDVKRVVERLCELGLCSRNGAIAEGGRAIYYKCDAWTYLEIGSGNEWGLRASMFSSREVLAEGK